MTPAAFSLSLKGADSDNFCHLKINDRHYCLEGWFLLHFSGFFDRSRSGTKQAARHRVISALAKRQIRTLTATVQRGAPGNGESL
jgi:hypothetical protein